MHLGIEIGGTKLQLGVGAGDGTALAALERFEVQPSRGAAGILDTIERAGSLLVQRHNIASVCCGFGGPVDAVRGRTIKSHHIEGWDNFPLATWLEQTLGRPAAIGNDCDVAGLAEARFGAGRGRRVVFYVTVGSGIGGGLMIEGQIHRGSGLAAAEIGHLRPGLYADRPEETVESIASGWGIAAEAQARVSGVFTHRLTETLHAHDEHIADLLDRCEGKVDLITAKLVVQAAEAGNGLAQQILAHATQALGWAIAQAVTLIAPEVVVMGGGLSLAGETLFLSPVREQVARYVFPPLRESYEIVPAQLGEEVVVHGALALAAS